MSKVGMGAMYKNFSFSEVCDILCEKKNTLIVFHARPDGDAIGSAFSLRLILQAIGMRAYCICETEIPRRLAFLTKGIQESLLEASIPEDFEIERVISVDTASPSQLGMLQEKYCGRVELMIDHHGNGIRYADGIIVPDAAAAGEIIFDIAKELVKQGKLKEINSAIALPIYAAISSDTGGFRYSSTSPQTHIRAAELIETGIDAADVNRRLFECKSYLQTRAETLGFENLHLYDDGKIAIIEFPYTLKAANNLEDEHLETLIDVARSVEGVEIAVALRQPRDKACFRCSVRSNYDFDVSVVCAELGGGGHKRAAGCSIDAENIHAATEKFLSVLFSHRGQANS